MDNKHKMFAAQNFSNERPFGGKRSQQQQNFQHQPAVEYGKVDGTKQNYRGPISNYQKPTNFQHDVAAWGQGGRGFKRQQSAGPSNRQFQQENRGVDRTADNQGACKCKCTCKNSGEVQQGKDNISTPPNNSSSFQDQIPNNNQRGRGRGRGLTRGRGRGRGAASPSSLGDCGYVSAYQWSYNSMMKYLDGGYLRKSSEEKKTTEDDKEKVFAEEDDKTTTKDTGDLSTNDEPLKEAQEPRNDAPVDAAPQNSQAPEPPITESTITEPLIDKPSIAESPIAEPPIAESPIAEPPIRESPIPEPHIAGSPIAESPIAESPIAESPIPEPPIVETEMAAALTEVCTEGNPNEAVSESPTTTHVPEEDRSKSVDVVEDAMEIEKEEMSPQADPANGFDDPGPATTHAPEEDGSKSVDVVDAALVVEDTMEIEKEEMAPQAVDDPGPETPAANQPFLDNVAGLGFLDMEEIYKEVYELE